MNSKDFNIGDMTYTVDISGSPEFKYGKDKIISNEEHYITYNQEWYDEGYNTSNILTEQELKDWIPSVRQLASHAGMTYLFFNNCHLGGAVKNARMMKEILAQQAKVPF